jgi:hypothetical protein
MIGTRLVVYTIYTIMVLSLIYALPTFGQLAVGDTKAKDAGLADPTVNPGQASGMRVVRGEVKQANLKTIVIEDSKGKETTMSIDAATAGDRDVRPGDIITGTITGQGRAITIHKEKEVAAER